MSEAGEHGRADAVEARWRVYSGRCDFCPSITLVHGDVVLHTLKRHPDVSVWVNGQQVHLDDEAVQ